MKQYTIGRYFLPSDVKSGTPTDEGVETPIVWLAIHETDDGKTLLLSRDILDWEWYDEKCLEQMYRLYFSDEEKQVLQRCEHGVVFFLSVDEIKRYLPESEDRQAVIIFDDLDGETYEESRFYWLRREEDSPYEAPYVDWYGNIEDGSPMWDEVGYRIAVMVDTEKAQKYLTAEDA